MTTCQTVWSTLVAERDSKSSDAPSSAPTPPSGTRPQRKKRTYIKRSFKIKDLPRDEQRKYRAECTRQWRRNNPERSLQSVRNWRQQNVERVRECNRARYARMKQAADAWAARNEHRNEPIANANGSSCHTNSACGAMQLQEFQAPSVPITDSGS